LVASGKGGSGKTTTSYNVAVQATLDGLRVLLVDLDSQQTLTRWHAVRPAEAPSIGIFTRRLRDLSVADLEDIDRKAAEGAADLVVVDTPPGLDDWPQQTRELVGRADMVLVPTSPGGPDVDSVVEWMGLLKREGAKAAFVLNRSDRRALSFEDAKARLNKAGLLCPIDVRRLADIEAVYRYGVGVAEMKGANGTQDVEGIWYYVRNMTGL
jgi:chromosome partitioning protein